MSQPHIIGSAIQGEATKTRCDNVPPTPGERGVFIIQYTDNISLKSLTFHCALLRFNSRQMGARWM
jgi:hypothetical protein